jgi:hypothetical protein
MKLRSKYYLFLIILIATLSGCTGEPHGNIAVVDRIASIDPDYTGITLPYNIAPMNFKITEDGSQFLVRFSDSKGKRIEVSSKNGIIIIPEGKWKKMLQENKGKNFDIEIYIKNNKEGWSKFKNITNTIAPEPIDPYITYRILYPGFESWKEIYIKQRSLESFNERSIIENSIVDENCVNCHSYNNNGTSENFLFHMRGSLGGTYFYSKGDFKKVNLKTKEMKNGAVYPRWHPSGKFVAFSSNKIVQQFHSALTKKVEVTDLESSLVLYDIDRNEMMNVDLPDKEKYMDTYPEWSPDGTYLYFCRAPKVGKIFEYDSVRYDLYRVPFDATTRKTGKTELVFDASSLNKSVSFPRISYNGRFLVLTLHNYGCFPIWHKEADLQIIDLQTLKPSMMALNSDFADSYHSWSSNSRWLVFSSKRIDGLTARFFISFIDVHGNSTKAFILPQKDPEFYQRFIKSFNLPEFSTMKVKVNPGKIRKSAKGDALQAKWVNN